LPQGVNPAEHNYIAKQLRLIASGVLDVPAGEVAEVLVYHDDGCPLLSGGTCRCDPDFRLVRRA